MPQSLRTNEMLTYNTTNNQQPVTNNSLPIPHHPHKPRPLNRPPQHFLVLETGARVVPVADVREVIGVGLERGVILVIDVARVLLAKRALLEARVRAALLLGLG